jgi:hypothetical protein
MQVMQSLRRRIERLGPYPALLIVAVPLAVVEPLKLVLLFVLGSGHWVTGAIAMVCAYAVSLFVAHWVFRIVKPKLLKLPWFARLWRWLVAATKWELPFCPAPQSTGGKQRPRR